MPHAAGSQQGSVSRLPAHFLGRAVALGTIAGGVIAVDQWTKSWALHNLSNTSPRHVLGPVYLVLSFNRGAAFSLGSGVSPVIEALASLLAVAVIAFSGRAARICLLYTSGTANVDRELDLHLSAQAQAAIEEIDAALVKITEGTYGFCESCGNPVPKARLEALPHARLCVSCKSGGLSARRQ